MLNPKSRVPSFSLNELYSYPPYPQGYILNPQWMPETADSTQPSRWHVTSCTYKPMINPICKLDTESNINNMEQLE